MTEVEQQAAGRGTKRSLLLISGPLHSTTSDRSPIPALDRFGGTLFNALRHLKRSNQLPSSLDIAIYTPIHGVVMSDVKLARVDPNVEPMSSGRILDELNHLLDRYDQVAVVVTDDDWAFLRRAEGFSRSTLQVMRLTGYRGDKLRKMREWIANL
jgi:hypothetical protein